MASEGAATTPTGLALGPRRFKCPACGFVCGSQGPAARVYDGHGNAVVEIPGCSACFVRRLGELVGPLPRLAAVAAELGVV